MPALAFGEEAALVHGPAEGVESGGSQGAAGVALDAPGCEVGGRWGQVGAEEAAGVLDTGTG